MSVLKKLMVSLLLLPTLTFAAANDVIITQRNTTDTGAITRFMTPPAGGANGVLGYIGSSQQPTLWTVGSGFSLAGSSLSVTPTAWGDITGKPTFFSGSYNDLTNKPVLFSGAYSDLTGKPVLFSGAYADLTGKPTLFDGTWASLTGKPTFATVATSGSYADLSNKPTIPAAQVQSDWNAVSGLGVILNKPTIPVLPTRSFTYPARSLNTAFQVSATRDAYVNYTVDVTVTSLLLAGQSGRVYLEYADNAAMTTNLVIVNEAANSTGGVLNVTNLGPGNVNGWIPAGKYARVRTANVAGTPTFTLVRAEEVLH